MEEKFMDETYDLAELDSATQQGFAVMDIKADLTAGKVSYCSMQAVDYRAKCSLFNAISKPAKISEMVNKRIRVAHIYIEAIEITNQKTGERVNVPRIVLIDDKANGYQAVSVGIYESIRRIIHMFGEPDTWQKPLTVEVKHISLKNGGHTYNLEAVFE